MHRIDSPGATAGNLFTEGNPPTIPATQVSDDWLNDVQENMAVAIEDAGIGLVKGDDTQLKAAIQAYAALGGGTLVTKNATFTATVGEAILLCDASGGDITANLPAAATAGAGKKYTVKKTDNSAFTVTINPDAAETVDGSATVQLADQNDMVQIVCDGTNWVAEGLSFTTLITHTIPSNGLTTAIWKALSSNSVTITPGVWDISLYYSAKRTTGGADLEEIRVILSDENGDNTGADPNNFSANANVTQLGLEVGPVVTLMSSTDKFDHVSGSVDAGRYRVSADTTAYIDGFMTAGTAVVELDGKIIARKLNMI